jgi:hypothetical protein
MERWRRPLVVLHAENHDTEQIWTPDGRHQRQVKVFYDRESTERIRAGMACAKCQEVWEIAWPERCPVCGAPIRDRQAEFFAKEFEMAHLGSRVSLVEELESLGERAERAMREGDHAA